MRFRFGLLAGAVAAALAVSGCGEIQNTIVPASSSFDSLTVLVPTVANANYVGIYEAQALGYYRQAALNVHLSYPSSGVTDTLTPLFNYHAEVALTDAPSLFLARDQSEALVAVAAIRNQPLSTVEAVREPVKAAAGATGATGAGAASKTTTGAQHTTPTGTATNGTPTAKQRTKLVYKTVPDTSLLPSSLRSRNDLPTYDGLVITVRKPTIVENSQLVRRFVQATARGYEAVKADPQAAVATLIAADPALAHSPKLALKQIENALGSFFPTGTGPWGWQDSTQWNQFGTWLYHQHLLTDVNAITDASTNELLAGEGV